MSSVDPYERNLIILVIFYVAGYILVASAQNIRAVAGGIITYAVYVHLTTNRGGSLID